MRKALRYAVFVLLAQVMVLGSSAAIPQQVNFQSKLNTAGGGLFNGSVNLNFEFFTDLAGINSTGWSETHVAVPVVDSVYSIAIGSLTSFPAGLFNQPLFVRIQIQPLTDANNVPLSLPLNPAETLSPLLPFRSVAYAFYAENIAASSVDSATIADGSVNTVDMADSAVTSAKINNGAVGVDELAIDAVDSDAILDGAIAASDLATDAVNSDKIMSGAVTTDEILDATIVAADLATGAVDSAKILDGSIATDDIADGAITAAKFAGGVVPGTDADLLDGKDSTEFFELAGSPLVSGNPKFQNGIKFFDDSVQMVAAVNTGSVFTVDVNCPADSVQNAIDTSMPGGLLIINISGTCNETVRISRDRVYLEGISAAMIIGQDVGEGAVNVKNVQGVRMNNVDLQSAVPAPLTPATEGGYGLMVADKGEVRMSNGSISNAAYGVFATRTGQIWLDTVNINNVSNYGVLLTDGASARIQKSNISVNLPETDFFEAAIAMYRGASMRIRDNSVISNAGGSGSGVHVALSVYIKGQLRLDKGVNSITGDVFLGDMTHVELRDFTLVGNVNIGEQSMLKVRDSTPASTTISGNVDIDAGGQLITGSDVKVDGYIAAWSQGSVRLGSDNQVTGELLVTRGQLDMGSNVVIDGPVRVNQAQFFSGDNVVLNSGFEALQSDVSFTSAGSNIKGYIRIADHSRLTVSNGFTTEEAVACVRSSIRLDDGTNFSPGVSAEAFTLNQCELFAGLNSQIGGSLFVENSSTVNLDNSSTLNGDISLQDSTLSLSDGVSLNGAVSSNATSLYFGGVGTTISGPVQLLANSETYIGPGPVFSEPLDCQDSSITFENTSFGSGILSPVLNSYRNCTLNIGDNVVINGDIQLGKGASLDIRGTAQINGDLNLSGARLGMEFGAVINGSLFANEFSTLNLYDDNGTPGTNAISGELLLSHSIASIANNISGVTAISVIERSDLIIGSGLNWSLSNQILVDNKSQVEVQNFGSATNISRAGAPDVIFSLGGDSTLRIADGTTLTGNINIDQGSSLSSFDGVTFNGAIYAQVNSNLQFGNANVVTVDIGCGGIDSITLGTTPLLSGGGTATPILGCTDRTAP